LSIPWLLGLADEVLVKKGYNLLFFYGYITRLPSMVKRRLSQPTYNLVCIGNLLTIPSEKWSH